MSSIEEMTQALIANPQVVGLVEYGSNHKADDYRVGDHDLIVVITERDPLVESLHFYVGDVPVDLNFVTLQEICSRNIQEPFHRAVLPEGRVIYDAIGDISEQLERLRQEQQPPSGLSEHTIAFMRHGHRHVLDKVKGRLDTMPVFCHFLLNTNVYWLVNAYFLVRNLPNRGEKSSLEFLQQQEPELSGIIQEFQMTFNLERKTELTHALTEAVLAPIGGMWQRGEVLTFGDEECVDLQEHGRRMYHWLFGGEFSGVT